MMFASFMNDLGTLLGILGGCFGLLLYALIFVAVKTAGRMKENFEHPGGAAGLAKRAGGTLLKAGIKRALLGRWR